MKKALFISNFGIDMGIPEFRVGSYINYLLPLSISFNRAMGGESKFLLGSHTLDLLNRKNNVYEINSDNSFVVRGKANSDLFGVGDEFILKSYNNNFEEKEKKNTKIFS